MEKRKFGTEPHPDSVEAKCSSFGFIDWDIPGICGVWILWTVSCKTKVFSRTGELAECQCQFGVDTETRKCAPSNVTEDIVDAPEAGSAGVFDEGKLPGKLQVDCTFANLTSGDVTPNSLRKKYKETQKKSKRLK